MTCNGCGSEQARHVRIRFIDAPDGKSWAKVETCNVCQDLPNAPPVFRDAAGNVVSWNEPHSRYSYATDSVITSKKNFSETLKKLNLIQHGGDHKGKTA